MARIINFVIGVSLVILITYLFIHARVNHKAFQEAEDYLHVLSHQEAMLRHDLVRIRYSLLSNYDSIMHNMHQVQDLTARLMQGPISIQAMGMTDLSPTLERLQMNLALQRQYTYDYQESNSVLKNSLAYFLTSASELSEKVLHSGAGEISSQISNMPALSRTILRYSLSGEKTPTALMLNWINRFENLKPELSETLHPDIDGLINHLGIIIEYQENTDQLLSKLTNLPVKNDIDTLMQGYKLKLDQENRHAQTFRSLLYVSSLALLAYLVITFLRLKRTSSDLVQSNSVLQTEVAERKQAEQALRTSEQHIQQLYDSTPDMYFTVSENGMVLSINRFGAQTLGYRQDELIMEPVWKIIYPDDLPVVKIHLEKIFSERKEHSEIEFRKIKKDGTVIWVHERIILITGSSSEMSELRISCRDVTDRKKMEEESRERQAQITHLARINTMGEMASGLAHELNQPLTAISTYANACLNMLHSGHEDTEKLVYGIKQTAVQAGRAGEIIRRLREFVRKDNSQRELVDVNDLVKDVIGMTATEARVKGVELQADLTQHVPLIPAAAIQIEQVILNLVRNSLDAIHLAGIEKGAISISTGNDGTGSVLVTVRDNGQGLDVENASQIFKPFHTTKADGMGMGLSISQSIIEAHDGRLWLDTVKESGAVFHFTLPAKREANVA